jgi:hypothetical protein
MKAPPGQRALCRALKNDAPGSTSWLLSSRACAEMKSLFIEKKFSARIWYNLGKKGF